MEITNDIRYVGVNDHKIDLFESQYAVPHGMAYNSYVIVDEKTAVMDTVDRRFTQEWLDNIEKVLGDRKPDYLIIQHMEPDHSANIKVFMDKYPEAIIVSSAVAFNMMKNFYGDNYTDRRIISKEGETLSLGRHILHFVAAPMVHWPEVMITYDETDKVLFSADAFGKFGANDTPDDNWADEARRYYIGIVGKYGEQVQALLAKAGGLDIQIICSTHGPVLKENLGYYIGLTNTWASYAVEDEGVVFCYTSVYGHTREAALLLQKKLQEKGCPAVPIYDLARDDMHKAISEAFRYGRIILATTTYNMGIFPPMETFINNLKERNFQKRKVGIIENGTWAPKAKKIITDMLSDCKDITFCQNNVTLKSAMNAQSDAQLDALADEIMQ